MITGTDIELMHVKANGDYKIRKLNEHRNIVIDWYTAADIPTMRLTVKSNDDRTLSTFVLNQLSHVDELEPKLGIFDRNITEHREAMKKQHPKPV
jgi:hypothetical protein